MCARDLGILQCMLAEQMFLPTEPSFPSSKSSVFFCNEINKTFDVICYHKTESIIKRNPILMPSYGQRLEIREMTLITKVRFDV